MEPGPQLFPAPHPSLPLGITVRWLPKDLTRGYLLVYLVMSMLWFNDRWLEAVPEKYFWPHE